MKTENNYECKNCLLECADNARLGSVHPHTKSLSLPLHKNSGI